MSSTEYTTPNDRQLVATRVFQAPRAKVFEAWTQPAHLKRWMLGPEGWSMPICEIDLRPGGKTRLVWRRDDAKGGEMQITSTYREVNAPSRLVSVESWGADWPDTVNTVELVENGSKTNMRLTIEWPTNEARENAATTGMRDGMSTSFDRLEEHLKHVK